MIKIIQRLIHKIKELSRFLFPCRCFGCEKRDEILCRQCISQLPPKTTGKTRYIDLFIAASGYQSPALRALIRQMKFRSSKNIADILGILLAQSMQEIAPILEKDTIIIPIPLSKKRMRERGYNQAERIAEKISLYHSFNLIRNGLIKIKNTPPQTSFSEKTKRAKNIRGAFNIGPSFSPSGKYILLIDDVMTSGATINEAARILKKAGALKVYAAVVAKG